MRDEGVYTSEQVAQIRQHLSRITRGLVGVVAEPLSDEPGYLLSIYCYEGESSYEGQVDCRCHGVVAEGALDTLAQWPAKSVVGGKLGCIYDPEEGMSYGDDVCELLDAIADVQEGGEEGMTEIEWWRASGTISEEYDARLRRLGY